MTDITSAKARRASILYRLQRAEQVLAALREELELEDVRSLIPHDAEEQTVLRFSLRFETGGRVYRYAAIKANGRWFTTGATCPRSGFSDSTLADFIRDADLVDGIETIRPGF